MLYFQLQQSLAVAGMLVAAVKLCFATAALPTKASDTKWTLIASIQITKKALFESQKWNALPDS
jgi:hypothetical protein